VAGRDQLILIGCNLVTSLDPRTGRKLWEREGSTEECVTSTVTDGERIFISGGYPRNHVSAVAADGSKRIAWENTARVYVPSMLVRDRHLFAVTDAGVATCWNSATGNEIWKHRLGGTFSSSPVLIGDRILVINEEGTAYMYAADPKKFTLLAENRLGDEVFASPVVCGGRIYLRLAEQVAGRRQEMLYCLGGSK
jgi:outer membrane protein assembly factor BamB